MLQLVLGRSGSGKTEYVFSKIKALAAQGKSNMLLITPEQFSFIAQKRLLSDLGERDFDRVESTSFTRLSQEISNRYGGDKLPVISKGAKAVMMKNAIESVQDHLLLFHKNITSVSFVNSFIRIYDELKSCRVTTQNILDASEEAQKDILSLKLKDIALIIDAYDALIKDRFYDPANELTRLYEKLLRLDYFKGRTAFIDGFSGFVAQEYKILEVILKQADTVYITFCTDTDRYRGKYDLFSYVNQNINILKDVCKKNGVSVAAPLFLSDNYRVQNEELLLAEQNAFSPVKHTYPDAPEFIHLYCAKNVTDECDYISGEISKLLRSGLKASDITVICRDLDKYERELSFSFNKYNIPYFDDERQQINSQPLMMFVSFLLRCVIYSYRSEDIFSLLKTGLTALDNDSINALENYAYLWSVNGSAWKKEFTQSTRGYVAVMTESDKRSLEAINQSREYVISLISRFRSRTKDADAAAICKALYYTVLDFSVDKQLKALALSLEKDGKSALAKEQGRIWDLFIDILDSIALTGTGSVITVKDFYKLFHLMITNEDLASVPIGLDNVQVGSADRIRCNNPKVVFIAGANEGEFPQAVTSSGLLSESDRISLIHNDFKLYSYGEALNAQEKYFAYSAMTAPTQQLFVSYRGSGENTTPSAIVRELRSTFEQLETVYYSDALTLDRIESDDNAFDLLASHYHDNNAFVSSLKGYFEGKEGYAKKLSALQRLTDNEEIRLTNRELAEKLFKKDMYLSASRIEDYYNCAFRYFCKFGLGARPRAKAQLDPMQTGTVIHYVLEQLIKEKGSLKEVNDAELRILINGYLTDYLSTQMGDSEQFTARFRYQFMRLSKMLISVAQRLKEEFEQSDFEAKAFEMKIGEGEEVPSKEIMLPDGGSIRINGAIDRVDTYTENGVQYVRVVDYKSGTKEFQLSDILNGLNLQMFIYLFTLCGSNHELAGISSGVLYMHSGRKLFSLDRNKDRASQLSKEENDLYKMKGVVLNDEAHPMAQHMERGLEGRYIPAKMKREVLSGNLVTLDELGRLSRKIDLLIQNMGIQLHSGCISQNPINGKNHDRTCEFCDYTDVCRNRREVNKKEMIELSFDETLIKIKEDVND